MKGVTLKASKHMGVSSSVGCAKSSSEAECSPRSALRWLAKRSWEQTPGAFLALPSAFCDRAQVFLLLCALGRGSRSRFGQRGRS